MNLFARTLLVAAALPLLAGCVNDAASYMIGGDRHNAITLMRTQKWPWDDTVVLSVVAERQPDCLGGAEIQHVPMDAPLVLHRAPNE